MNLFGQLAIISGIAPRCFDTEKNSSLTATPAVMHSGCPPCGACTYLRYRCD